jgi:hypothetical protein
MANMVWPLQLIFEQIYEMMLWTIIFLNLFQHIMYVDESQLAWVKMNLKSFLCMLRDPLKKD